MIRPPLVAGKLRAVDDGTLSFTLKNPWSDGTTHLVLSPLELIEKLAALVPPPRLNLVRYHGLRPNPPKRRNPRQNRTPLPLAQVGRTPFILPIRGA